MLYYQENWENITDSMEKKIDDNKQDCTKLFIKNIKLE